MVVPSPAGDVVACDVQSSSEDVGIACFSMIDSCEVGVQVEAREAISSLDVGVQVELHIEDYDRPFDEMSKAYEELLASLQGSTVEKQWLSIAGRSTLPPPPLEPPPLVPWWDDVHDDDWSHTFGDCLQPVEVDFGGGGADVRETFLPACGRFHEVLSLTRRPVGASTLVEASAG